MKRIRILPIIALSILLADLISFPAKADFNAKFFNSNNITYYDAGDDCGTGGGGGSGSTNLEGNDNAEKIWNFFKSKGWSDEQVAGVMGSLWGESNHFQPDLNEAGSGIGYGIAQWSFGRRTNLENYAKEKGKPVSDLGVQLDFLWTELEGPEVAAKNAVSSAKSVKEATTAWTLQFERPREDLRPGRIQEGEQVGNDILAKYKGKGGKSSGSSSSSSNSSSSNSSSSSPNSGSSSSNSSSNSGKITFIGDSITVGVQDKLTSTFSGSNVSATVGDSIAAATSKLPAEINDTVVINLGTNDNFDEGAAETLLGKLKGKKIYWVNNFSKGGNADYEVINKKLSAFASKHSEVKVLDWKAYAEKNGGREKLYSGDGIHPNTEGQEAYVKFLQEALNGGGNNSSKSSDSCGATGSSSGKFMTSADASHTTSDGFSVFEQCDPRWANEQWGKNPGNTMCHAACGPTSVSNMVLALTGKSISPLEMAKKAAEKGYEAGYGTTLGVVEMVQDYGLKQSKIDISVNAVEDVLKKGGLVMLAGTGPGPFLNTSHYVVIRKSSGGKWYTANPGRKELDDTPYDPSYVISMTFAAFGVTK